MTNKEILEQNGAEIAACLELADKIPIPQEKEVTVNENGVTEILPDDGKVFSKVTLTTEVTGGGAELNIAYGDNPPEDTTKLWVKSSAPKGVFVSTEKVLTEGGQEETFNEYAISYTRTYGGAAAVDGKIYLFGGRTSSSTTGATSIVRFDPSTKTVTTLSATLPTGLNHIACAVYGKKIYLFGGSSGDGTAMGTLYNHIIEFDTVELKRRTLGATLPTVLCDACVATVGSKIYIFGGRTAADTTNYTDKIFVFEPESEQLYTAPTTLPTATWGASCAAVGTNIYVFGGSASLKNIFRYDTVTSVIESLSRKLPDDRTLFGCSVVEGVIVLIGGAKDSIGAGSSYNVWTFDPTTNTIKVSGFTGSNWQKQNTVVTVGTKAYSVLGNSSGYVYEYAPQLGHLVLDHERLQIYPHATANIFPLINTDMARVEIGVEKVHKGNENNEPEPVEAALYKDGGWVTI